MFSSTNYQDFLRGVKSWVWDINPSLNIANKEDSKKAISELANQIQALAKIHGLEINITNTDFSIREK